MTIRKFLAGSIDKNSLSDILTNNSLRNIDIELFFKEFGVMTKDQMIAFLKDPANSFAIGKFGYRYSGQNRYIVINSYNYDVTEQMY